MSPRENWARAGVEPSLADLMHDPIVHLIMRRDNVAPSDLLKVVARARAHLCVASSRTRAGELQGVPSNEALCK